MAEQVSEAAVLFVDVGGTTKLYETPADALLQAAMESCVRLMEQKTQAAKGRVVKTTGDDVIAMFSTADAAADAAVEIQLAISELPAFRNTALGIRIGCKYGPVVERDGQVSGDAVNLAARLAGVATRGQIVFARDTVMRMSPLLKASARAIPIQIKGEPLEGQVYEVMWRFNEDLTTLGSNRPLGTRNVFRGGTRLGTRIERGTVRDSAIEPALHVRFSGDKVKERVVETGSICRLSVDWGLLTGDALVKVTGKELQRAREQRLEVVFVLYSGKFKVDGGKTRIATRFKDDGFETPVEFGLIAPAKAVQQRIFLEMEVHGRPAQRIPLSLEVVDRLEQATRSAHAAPLKLDFDRLINQSQRAAPVAILRLASTASPPFAQLEVLQPFKAISRPNPALNQVSLANYLGARAADMAAVADDAVWDELADPLHPAPGELSKLAQPLALSASVGSVLHDWLAGPAGMRDMLDHIDGLAPGSRIVVHTDDVAIPWEMIYPPRYRIEDSPNPGPDVDVAKFWGYRFEFETYLTPAQHSLPEGDLDLIDQHVKSERRLTAVLNNGIDDERPWKAGAPVKYQRGRFDGASFLSGVDVREECPNVRKLLNTETRGGALIYFYCHGAAEGPFDPARREVLQLGAQCLIKPDALSEERFIDAPIVFLNSCSSGPLAALSFDSFCAGFLRKGALGLITTSFTIPAPFAARFGCELILRYMKGERALGELLLELRRDALDARIPLGLFYMLRCPSDVTRSSA